MCASWASATRCDGARRGMGLTRARRLITVARPCRILTGFQILRELLHCIARDRPATGPSGAGPPSRVGSTIMRSRPAARRAGQDHVPSRPRCCWWSSWSASCSTRSWRTPPAAGWLFEVFGALVLALAIWSVRDSPGPTWIVDHPRRAWPPRCRSPTRSATAPPCRARSAVCHALFYFYAAGSLMVYMLADRYVTTDELYAVGATFTLVAWAFAYVFAFVQIAAAGLLHRRGQPRRSRGPGWNCCS